MGDDDNDIDDGEHNVGDCYEGGVDLGDYDNGNHDVVLAMAILLCYVNFLCKCMYT